MIRQLLICAVASCFLAAVVVRRSTAETVFFDDFSDGSASNNIPLDRNGDPVVWTPLAGFDSGTFDASSGDYMLASQDGSPQAALVLSNVLTNISVRAQVRTDADTFHGLFARADLNAFTAYAAGVSPFSGNAFIQRNTPFAFVLAAEPIDLNPSEEDIILQFDLIGDQLSLFAWRTGERKPDLPAVTVTDSAFQEGVVGVMNDAGLAPQYPASSTYRFVHVADTPIAPTLPGDYNENDAVDAADFTVWRDGLGSSYTQPDYNVWKATFGSTLGAGSDAALPSAASAAGASPAIPEPSALTLAAFAVGVLTSRLRLTKSPPNFVDLWPDPEENPRLPE